MDRNIKICFDMTQMGTCTLLSRVPTTSRSMAICRKKRAKPKLSLVTLCLLSITDHRLVVGLFSLTLPDSFVELCLSANVCLSRLVGIIADPFGWCLDDLVTEYNDAVFGQLKKLFAPSCLCERTHSSRRGTEEVVRLWTISPSHDSDCDGDVLFCSLLCILPPASLISS